MCWKNVDVVRPQPGHAVTCGAKLRSPSDWRICCATSTSSVRSPFGFGVSETRIVSPMPSREQNREAGRAGDDALRAHPGLGESEVQRVVAARGEPAIDVDEILHAGDLRRNDDLVVPKPDLLGELRGAKRAGEHRLDVDVLRVERLGAARVLVHHLREQILVERAPVHADAHRLVVVDGDLDDRAKILVAALAADVARIDAVLRQRARAVRVLARAADARCSGSRRRSAR